MIKSNYDKIEHKCKVCGTLMTEDYFTNHHTAGDCLRDKVHRDERIKPFQVKSIYKVGEEIEASIIGVIEEVVKTSTGKIYYKVRDKENSSYGLFKESQIEELIKPENFNEEAGY